MVVSSLWPKLMASAQRRTAEAGQRKRQQPRTGLVFETHALATSATVTTTGRTRQTSGRETLFRWQRKDATGRDRGPEKRQRQRRQRRARPETLLQ